jgi:hypothetical protein
MDQALALDELCRSRPEDTTEAFAPNSWYGSARVIRDYCGWPQNRSLPMVVPHGVNLLSADLDTWEPELTAALPALYSFPPSRDAAYRRLTDKTVIAGCSPWLYIRKPDVSAAGKSVLLMPAHSSHHVRSDTDAGLFVQAARARFPDRAIQCCIYWQDVQLDRHRQYLDMGIPVVSAGHMFDPFFFERLATIFAAADAVFTNEIGSHVFYAAAMGVPVLVTDAVGVEWVAPQETLDRDCGVGPFHDDVLEILPLFRTDSPNVALQQEAALRLLGNERRLTPSAMAVLLTRLAVDAGWEVPS